MDFHTLHANDVLKKLKTSAAGLREADVGRRFKKHGPNRLPQAKKAGQLEIIIAQFKSPLMYILVLAGLVTFTLRDYTDALVIFMAVLVNAAVGYVQERKANASLEALNQLVKNRVVVRRAGHEHEVDQEDLTVGDIVLLRAGDKVPADGRVLSAQELKINESALTGEWLAVSKKPESLPKETFFADRLNIAYMGTLVESGSGEMVVTGVGRHTEFGRIATLIGVTAEAPTPYQQRLARFSKVLGLVIVGVCVLIFTQGIASGGGFEEMFVTAIAVAVAAIPEGLPMAMTVILAIGMQRLLKRKGLVRALSSAETLGSTSVICTDKTGTLTQGRMEVVDVLAPDEAYDSSGPHKNGTSAAHRHAYTGMTLLSEAFIENPRDKVHAWIVRGRPTDKALLLSGYRAGYVKDTLAADYREVGRLPFSSAEKFCAGLFTTKAGASWLYVMGAPEVVLARSSEMLVNGKAGTLTPKRRAQLQAVLTRLAGQGLRVMAIAYARPARREVESARDGALPDSLVQNVVFSGFVALKDPLRASARAAVKTAQAAGLRPVMITGDHQLTARAIAAELGFKLAEQSVMEGRELDKLTDAQLIERVREIAVYARVRPEQKLRIVNAWQALGEVVAMTGDGINDAPALKKADVGVALGSGTTVAKEVSDLVLLTDDFSIIIAAIEEGRVIVDNIRKVITYLLSSSFSEIILIGAALLMGWPLPVVAVQILWVNIIQDGLPNVALAFEPREPDVMRRRPLRREAPLLNGEMRSIIFIIGILTDIMLLAVFYAFYRYSLYDIEHIRSLVFAALSLAATLYIYSCKSLRQNIWKLNLFSNPYLLAATGAGLLALGAVFYVPVLQTVFQTVPLSLFDWSLVLALGLANIILIEASKWFYIRRQATD